MPGYSRVVQLAVACLLAAGATTAFACVNTLKSNILHYKWSGEKELLTTEIRKLELAYQADPNLEHTNDLAVGRMLTDRLAEAIQLLVEAEKRFPGKAVVAANLGTAYELAGRDAEALHWIREGVRRDPREHDGSEWLHARILEAKLALKSDPDWLEENAVLGVNFGEGDLPRMPAALPTGAAGRARTPAEIAAAIEYQLGERINFVRPPDAIVADLYATWGDLAFASARAGNIEVYMADPAHLYSEALRYGSANAMRVKMRKVQFETAYPGTTWLLQFKEFRMR
jgi:hypothetical protein